MIPFRCPGSGECNANPGRIAAVGVISA
jgi:hypothetical protein